MCKRILIVEDELAIQSVLKELLTDAGFLVDTANDGLAGITAFRKQKYDLVLLDIMMPKLDGYSVCRKIRKESQVPIVMLTALDEEQAQIEAFELQIDDYITKPFSLKLVLHRIEAVLRRGVADKGKEAEKVLRYKDIELNPISLQVFVAGKEVFLTHIEFQLLHLFMKHPGRVFTRDNLIQRVWGYDFVGDEKTVNIHIMNLRKKLNSRCIETIRGVGYRFAKEDKK